MHKFIVSSSKRERKVENRECVRFFFSLYLLLSINSEFRVLGDCWYWEYSQKKRENLWHTFGFLDSEWSLHSSRFLIRSASLWCIILIIISVVISIHADCGPNTHATIEDIWMHLASSRIIIPGLTSFDVSQCLDGTPGIVSTFNFRSCGPFERQAECRWLLAGRDIELSRLFWPEKRKSTVFHILWSAPLHRIRCRSNWRK